MCEQSTSLARLGKRPSLAVFSNSVVIGPCSLTMMVISEKTTGLCDNC
jgi:hypothetical protein